MEEERIDAPEVETPYEPRPVWQVWAARVALVLFIGLIIMYYVNISQGGL